jgi:hypothetical protein
MSNSDSDSETKKQVICDNCDKKCIPKEKYCRLCICKKDDCPNACIGDGDYCANCCCQADGCTYNPVNSYIYCSGHLCQESNCENQTMNEDVEFCKIHWKEKRRERGVRHDSDSD